MNNSFLAGDTFMAWAARMKKSKKRSRKGDKRQKFMHKGESYVERNHQPHLVEHSHSFSGL